MTELLLTPDMILTDSNRSYERYTRRIMSRLAWNDVRARECREARLRMEVAALRGDG